jgi:hypothetical protein
LQPHCKGCCSHLYFHQVTNTNLVAFWQCHGMDLFEVVFLQSHFTCFCNCFFAIAAQWMQSHCNGFCNHPYFHQVAIASSKH